MKNTILVVMMFLYIQVVLVIHSSVKTTHIIRDYSIAPESYFQMNLLSNVTKTNANRQVREKTVKIEF